VRAECFENLLWAQSPRPYFPDTDPSHHQRRRHEGDFQAVGSGWTGQGQLSDM